MKTLVKFLLIQFLCLSYISNWVQAQNSIVHELDSLIIENVIIPSDDIEMHGVLYRSNVTDESGPAIILVHGWMPYDTEAQWDVNSAKRIASYGFTTLAITMRGWQKTGGIDDCGWKQPYDVVNAVKWLSQQEGIEPNRIGLLGASQGGQVNLYAASLESSVKIKAVAAYFPVTNVELWVQETDWNKEVKNKIKKKCSQEVSMDERSPLIRANQIKAPVLLLHGDQDTNIPIAHSETMLKALLDNGTDAELYVVKNGTHHYDGSPKWEKSFLRMIEFFSEKL